MGKMRVDGDRKRCYNDHCLQRFACVAQLVEQLTRNEQVAGSSPATSSRLHADHAGSFSMCRNGKNDMLWPRRTRGLPPAWRAAGGHLRCGSGAGERWQQGFASRWNGKTSGADPADKLLHYNNNRWRAEQLRILQWSLSMLL